MKFKFFLVLLGFLLKLSSYRILFFTANPIVSVLVSNIIYGYLGIFGLLGVFLATLIASQNIYISMLQSVFIIISTPLCIALASNIKYLLKRITLKNQEKCLQSIPKFKSVFTATNQELALIDKKQLPILVKSAISPRLVKLLYGYVLSKYNSEFYIESKNHQVPGSSAIYGEILMEALLDYLTPFVETATGFELYPTYSTCRVYSKNQELPRHHDRNSCEITVTINIGCDHSNMDSDYVWPIYLEDKSINKTTKFLVDIGDALIYNGIQNYHYRDKLLANMQAQILLHYVDKTGPYKKYKYDLRDGIGKSELNALNYFLKERL